MKSADDYIMTFAKESYSRLMEAYGFERLNLDEIAEFAQSVVSSVSRENLDKTEIAEEIDPELRAEIFSEAFVVTWKNILESDVRISIEKAAELLVDKWSRVAA
jgi:hypothetical protein